VKSLAVRGAPGNRMPPTFSIRELFLLKVELTSNAAAWVQAEIAAGHFANADEAINHAINKAKLTGLRNTLSESIARGGNNSADDVLTYAKTILSTEAL
jgi:hypothetical protein